MTSRVIQGDALSVLATIPTHSVHCIITSPPYYNLRDYGTGTWQGGDPACDHRVYKGGHGEASAKQVTSAGTQMYLYTGQCGKCGAKRTDQQIGSESIPDCLAWSRGEPPCGACYVCGLRDVFCEAFRVLHPAGTLWLNLGDSYNGSNKGYNGHGKEWVGGKKQRTNNGSMGLLPTFAPGLKRKDLLGIPWRVAFALQADGWYLRSDVVWHKPNVMPESVTDRLTKGHEYVFLLSKRPKYYFDYFAIQEPAADEVRRKRTVWSINTKPFRGAHFATFPTDLVEPMILAGTSEYGHCGECGAPWVRVGAGGWQPSCGCNTSVVPATVLDPFAGAGTVGLVAGELGRCAILIEMKPDYCQMIEKRLHEPE